MLRLSLAAPDGTPLPGTDAQLTVDATHFGATAMVIVAIAIAVFVVTAIARAVRRGGASGAFLSPHKSPGPGQDANGAEPAGSPGETDTVVSEPPVITTHPRSRMSTPAPQAGWSAPDGGRGHRRAPGRHGRGRAGGAGGGADPGQRQPARLTPGEASYQAPWAERVPPGGPGERMPARGGPGGGPGPPRTDRPGPEGGSSLLRSSCVMALGTLASRGTGFLRTLMLVYALGVTARVANAYNNANTLPNAVYDLMLGGILTSVVVPLLVNAAKRDTDRGEAYDQRMFTLATVALLGAHRGRHPGREPAGRPLRARAHAGRSAT